MQNDNVSESEDFIRMIQVISDNEELTKWFIALRPMADNLRNSVLGSMIEEMKANREDPDLVAAIQSLTNPAVFDAAFKTIVKLTK